MDFQTFALLGGFIVAGITIWNFIQNIGHKSGATDAQLQHQAAVEKSSLTKYEALHGLVTLHYQQLNDRINSQATETSSRFERVLERLNEALLTMAREHPTKADLTTMKDEILARIDDSHYTTAYKRRIDE